jgi:hypothetical protein
VDLPFASITDDAGCLIAAQRATYAAFPQRDWSADWYSWVVLTDFVANTELQGISLCPWNPAEVENELNCLIRAALEERADALGEIFAQANEFISFFMNVMTIRPSSHPETTKLFHIAGLVGLFAVMYFKSKDAGAGSDPASRPRPRPSQLCPALAPPIAVPGHASWPSGHSTQAHLMALCIKDVLPQDKTGLNVDLLALARRIARNREIAGLHYPSDSAAGCELAAKLHGLLGDLKIYNGVVTKAKAEWTDADTLHGDR